MAISQIYYFKQTFLGVKGVLQMALFWRAKIFQGFSRKHLIAIATQYK
jgi:hypothetical protein